MRCLKTRLLGPVALLSLALGLVVAPNAVAAGSPNLSISATAPGSVLFGGKAQDSITASNPAGQPYGYNLTFTDVLPNGISYVGGRPRSLVRPWNRRSCITRPRLGKPRWSGPTSPTSLRLIGDH